MITHQLMHAIRASTPVVAAPLSDIDRPLFGTAMASESNADFKITDSLHFGTDAGWRAFDAPAVPDTRSYWYPYPYNAANWLQVECTVPKTLRSFRLFHNMESALGSGIPGYQPAIVKIEAAQNAAGPWTVLEAAKNVLPWLNVRATQWISITNSLSVSNNTAYKFYRFSFTRSGTANTCVSCLMLSEESTLLVTPGTPHVLGGNETDGYYGEVDSASLILYSALVSAVGAGGIGASGNNDQYYWMKFRSEGKTLFIAKQNPRFQLSWNQLNALGLVYGEKTVVTAGRTYKVRLLTTAEWDKLMYPIAATRPGGAENWGGNFTQTNLGMNGTVSRQCHVQDGGSETNCITRGNQTLITATNTYTKAQVTTDMGWRPVLELVE